MPHVVLNGKVKVEDIFSKIKPLFIKFEQGMVKTTECFISQRYNSMIIKTLNIEKENKISFLILINDREDGIVIRLYPDLDVKKTIGVKKSLVEVAKQILKDFDKLTIGKTNLNEYFRKIEA
jgi:hypothetical protein